MTSADVRQSFFDFFRSKGHQIVPSASLMPTSPNLLFTNAGMNQFVSYFLGEAEPPKTRIADTQKCIRAGGKHNDLEDVGYDTYHHTLFEMLGNWSFGDYFKEEAIEWAWELLTQVWKFPKERLYATVYEPGKDEPADFDQEAWDKWAEIFRREGMRPDKHILTGGAKDNFWMMGDSGPCGPCSEVHMDLTPAGDTDGALVNKDNPFCIEIWNLVFIQFNADGNGGYTPLKQKHVDTGMGFERVCGILSTTQNFTDFTQPPSNYNSDLFTDLFGHISNLSGQTYRYTMPDNRQELSGEEMTDVIFRVLADHIRTLSFSIADGILPGNTGRNYVLRRILRRAVMFGKRLELKPGFFTKLVDPLVNKMGPCFPELEKQREVIRKVIHAEEQAFDRTLDRGLQLLDKITFDGDGKITGEEAFVLYDTYGFPIDLTQLIARERGLRLDYEGFVNEMAKRRKQSQEGQQTERISVVEHGERLHSTQFIGFDETELSGAETRFVGMFEGDDHDFLVFAQSPFYAEMGGQIGDTGNIRFEDGKEVRVLDTVKDELAHHLHKVEAGAVSQDRIGRSVVLSLDLERRRAIQRHHSATHLLNWALRETLGDHVKQAGSLVAPDVLRFDFQHFEQVKPEQIHAIEEMVNQRIIENGGVQWYEIPFDEKPEDVIATFGEKYGAVVRVVDIGGYSKELCGGTHVSATGEVGLFKITQETAVAAGTRRISAVCGEAAFRLAESNYQQIHQLAGRLACKPEEVVDRMEKLLERQKELEKQLRAREQQEAAGQGQALKESAIEHDGLNFVTGVVKAANPNDMRGVAVGLGKELGPSVVVLGGVFGEKVTLVALCSEEAVAQGYQAGSIVQKLTGQLGGKGGGKPDFAMGGAKDAQNLASVLQTFRENPQK